MRAAMRIGRRPHASCVAFSHGARSDRTKRDSPQLRYAPKLASDPVSLVGLIAASRPAPSSSARLVVRPRLPRLVSDSAGPVRRPVSSFRPAVFLRLVSAPRPVPSSSARFSFCGSRSLSRFVASSGPLFLDSACRSAPFRLASASVGPPRSSFGLVSSPRAPCRGVSGSAARFRRGSV